MSDFRLRLEMWKIFCTNAPFGLLQSKTLRAQGIDVSHETIRLWWNRFGLLFAAEIRRNRVRRMRAYSNWQWHLDEVFVKINGEFHYLWRVGDHEGEVLETTVTKRRDRRAALRFLRKTMKRYSNPEVIVTNKLRSYGAAIKVIGNDNARRSVAGKTIGRRIHTCLFDEEKGQCCVSVEREVYRNSLPPSLQSTTISIRNAAFLNEIISSSTAQPLLLSGINFVPHKFTLYVVS